MTGARGRALATATVMVMMTAMAKAMASLMVMRTGMCNRWKAALCGRCSFGVGGSGVKEDTSEMVTMTNLATETSQQRDNQPACKGQEAPADNRRLTRCGRNDRTG